MIRFFKLTGSGNDFIFIDLRSGGAARRLRAPERIQALCARGTGIGADGVVFLEANPEADIGIHYFNADGSLAALCGNATLCTTRLAPELGIGTAGGLRIATDSGIVRARLVGGVPEFDIDTIERVTPSAPIPLMAGEHRVGYAVVGVPHLVIEVDDVDAIDLVRRGSLVRTSTSWRRTRAAAGRCGPTSAVWRRRRWRAAPGRWRRRRSWVSGGGTRLTRSASGRGQALRWM
jgi:diaminopimelate epimerase